MFMCNIKEYFSIWTRGQDAKTRNFEDKSIISTLSGYRDAISALCNVNKSLIWSKSTPESSITSSKILDNYLDGTLCKINFE